ncbi:MAG TPA: FxLYD domain-containing protein [Nitrosopumilaceae archaeon]|nr:FxLYD domain-containing protein [Nitrosopumilaceae archaeon]
MKKLLLFLITIFSVQYAWAEVSIQNDQQYFSEDGTLHIVGEIQNNFNVPLNQINVQAELFSNGNLVEIVEIPLMLNNIMPEMKAPFDLVVSGKDAKNIDEYSLKIFHKLTDPKSQVIDITTSDMKIDNSDNLLITGTVVNHGDFTANSIVIVATLYDKNGKVMTAHKTHVEPDYLRAGEDAFFFMSIPDKSFTNSIVDYSLVAESDEFTAVPEFPIGSTILLASSVIAYLSLIKYSSRITVNLVSAVNPK